MSAPAPKPSIDTCNACGKLFPRLGIQLCAKCAPVEEHRFQLVRQYLDANEGAPVGTVARATGVSASDVRNFVDGGRLISLQVGQTCTCGGVGDRCRFCRRELATGLRSLEQTMQREQGERGDDRNDSARTSYVRRIRRVGE